MGNNKRAKRRADDVDKYYISSPDPAKHQPRILVRKKQQRRYLDAKVRLEQSQVSSSGITPDDRPEEYSIYMYPRNNRALYTDIGQQPQGSHSVQPLKATLSGSTTPGTSTAPPSNPRTGAMELPPLFCLHQPKVPQPPSPNPRGSHSVQPLTFTATLSGSTTSATSPAPPPNPRTRAMELPPLFCSSRPNIPPPPSPLPNALPPCIRTNRATI